MKRFCAGLLLLQTQVFASSTLPYAEIALMLKESRLAEDCQVVDLAQNENELKFTLAKQNQTRTFSLRSNQTSTTWFVGRGMEAKGGFWRLSLTNTEPKPDAIEKWTFKVRDNTFNAEPFKIQFVSSENEKTTWDCSAK